MYGVRMVKYIVSRTIGDGEERERCVILACCDW